MGNGLPPGVTELFALMEKQRAEADQRRRAAIEAEWKQFGEIRDKALLFRIGFSSQEFVNALVAAHPAKKLHDSIGNVKTAFAILHQSRGAFVDLAGKFHSRVVHQLHDDEDQKDALSEATREVYTYSSAAVSLVQAYRHMVSENSDYKDKYDSLRSEIFGDATIIRFFSDLRNSNNHIHILIASPHYTITNRFDGKPEVKSGISFNRNKILQSEDWSKDSKAYVTERKDLEVIDLIDEHFKLASQFNEVVLFRTGIHADKGYRDLNRIFHARTIMGHRHSLAILLQIAVPKKLNPYEYLHRWFTEEELKNIYSFADHSAEQLEYIISLRDPFGFCDQHTRKELYKLFSVPLNLLPDIPPEKPQLDF